MNVVDGLPAIARELSKGVRRVTTGVNTEGRSVILTDEIVRGDIRGIQLWAADVPPRVGDGTVPLIAEWWPPPGGFRICLGTRAPDSAPALPPGVSQPWPDIHDARGFHASNSIDILIMISGRIWLELDDGVEVELRSGDVLVQNGANHRWHNHADEWPLMAILIVGAQPA